MSSRAAASNHAEEPREFPEPIQRLFELPESLQQTFFNYQANRPVYGDSLETFQEKIDEQERSVAEVFNITASLIQQRGSVSQPAMVIRPLTPLFDKPRYEVRSIMERADAELGRPLFVVADPGLEGEIEAGDIVVISADGSMVIDVDKEFKRGGESGVVTKILEDCHQFPFEVELEGEASRRVGAIKWARLAATPNVGDRVKVMGGIIHSFAPPDTYSSFRKEPRTDLDRSDLHGLVPQMTLRQMEKEAHRYFHPEEYPKRSGRFDNGKYFLLYGPAGVGKSWTVVVLWSILANRYNNGTEKVVFLYTEGTSIEGSLVGSGPKNLRELRTQAKRAVEQGKLPVCFVNEAGSLLRDRKVQGMQLDGGSSIATHEQFLAMLSGPDEIPGILIVDLNTEKTLDEATRQRFSCIGYPHIDRATFVDRMFKGAYERERELFSEEWGDCRAALVESLETSIGTVLVGSEIVPVRVGNLISGRLYEKVMEDCLRMVDLSIYSGREQNVLPLFENITPPLLFYALTHRSWELFRCWDENQAQERIVPDLVRPEKARSISRPTAFSWHEIEMPADYDCREMLDALAMPYEETALTV
jgi:hypothetical protein